MRRLGAVLVLVLATVGLAPAAPAQAGGWAMTVLDPLPTRIEPDRTYTVGYWVLQHGFHPYEGELGDTGLDLVGSGRTLHFTARALPEAAHYAVAVAVPAGSWTVVARQGWFAPVEVGRLTVPGGLVRTPSEIADNAVMRRPAGGKPYWGAVHPPYVYGGEGAVQPVREPAEATPAAGPAAAPAAAPAPAEEPAPRAAVAVGLLAACGVLALFAAGPGRRLRRRLRG